MAQRPPGQVIPQTSPGESPFASPSPFVGPANLPNSGAPSRPASNGPGPSAPPAPSTPTAAPSPAPAQGPMVFAHHYASDAHVSPPVSQGPFQQGHPPSPPAQHHAHSSIVPPPMPHSVQVNGHDGQSPQSGPPPPIPQGFKLPSFSSPPSAATVVPVNQGVPFTDEYLALADCIKRTSPGTVRHVLRDNWEKALLGSQYHLAFFLNATIHQASPETLSRAIQDFGSRMIRGSKQSVVQHLQSGDFDELADKVLCKVSNDFLDKALARRFETIPARQLVNALARAERLGYDVRDIVEEEKHGTEHVIPSMHSLGIASCSSGDATPTPPPPPAVVQTPRKPENTPNKRPVEGPKGTLTCNVCGWPCAGTVALEYHLKKGACNKATDSDRVSKEICPCCGCRYGSAGGLVYHMRGNVCGNYSEEVKETTIGLINDFRANAAKGSGRHNFVLASTPKASTPSGSATPNGDPYAKLTPDQRQAFKSEMAAAEEFYGALMRDAMKLPEPEREKQLYSLKNRYNTKQSMTRRKYGVRLRERRSKAVIDAEKTRLFGSPDGPSLSGRDHGGPSTKRAKVNHSVSPASEPAQPSNPADSPRKRVPVSEMGGLSGSSATAELMDPTAYLTSSQPRHLQSPAAPLSSSSPRLSPPGEARPNGHVRSSLNQVMQAPAHGTGTESQPMAIDDDSNSDSGSDSDSDGDSTESDDEDIPATVNRKTSNRN